MGCECNKTTNTCGDKIYAACVYYETELPSFTLITGNECKTIELVVADIYTILGNIKSEIDLTILEVNGIDYTLEEGKILTKNAFKKHAEMLINFEERVSSLEDEDQVFNISDWGLDFECLADNCDEPPTTLKELLQLMITQICANAVAP